MGQIDFAQFLKPEHWHSQKRGPRYQQLYQHLRKSISDGILIADTVLPPEREMALHADVSRVTIRKAMGALEGDGLLQRRQGSGSTVLPQNQPRLQQSLSSLVSFTETMELRGLVSHSKVLSVGLFMPTPGETTALGLPGFARVARIKRLRFIETGPIAIESSTLPVDILPDPLVVDQSLYAVLRETGLAPVRAIQRISAVNLGADDADLLAVQSGAAFLKIVRTGYLENGRPIEFTSGYYHSDVYDFIAEVRLDQET